jgi:nicotinate-nucleotide--dimethylbenzimidazole phosphoribosyltransferase
MVIDGVISAVAALCAVRVEPKVIDYLIPSHASTEPAALLVLEALGLEPVIRADMRLGEGTGAVALFPLLDMTIAAYNDTARFSEL